MRILPRHGRRDVVARRRAVPDLPALVRGLRRRRDRRPARHPGAAGPPRVARRRRDLAQPDDALAERRLGLRRRRLHRGAPGPRHARGPRRAGRGRRRARDPRAARPGPEPHERPPRVVRRRARRPRRRAPRLLRLGRPGGRTAGRRTTGSRTSAARPGRSTSPAASTTCTTSCRPSPTSTGGTTTSATRSTRSCGSGTTAASRASGSTSATRSSRTASCATTRRSTPDDHPEVQKRPRAPGLLDEPARGPRRAAPLARRCPTRRTRSACSSARPTCSTSTS